MPVELWRLCMSVYVDVGKKKKKKMPEILFLMSCMRCNGNVELNAIHSAVVKFSRK